MKHYSFSASFTELLLSKKSKTQVNGNGVGFLASWWRPMSLCSAELLGCLVYVLHILYSLCSSWCPLLLGHRVDMVFGWVIPQHIRYALIFQWYTVYDQAIPKNSKTKFKEETWESGACSERNMRAPGTRHVGMWGMLGVTENRRLHLKEGLVFQYSDVCQVKLRVCLFSMIWMMRETH